MTYIVDIIQLLLLLGVLVTLYTHHRMDLESGTRKSLKAIVNIVMNKSHYYYGHSSRVSLIAKVICEGLKIHGHDKQNIVESAFLHDIGKICVDSSLLEKNGSLEAYEMKTMKDHSVRGYDIVKGFDLAPSICGAVLYHHENYDGTGYPLNLSGENIPIGARIIRVADSIDAMGSERPYRKAMEYDQIAEQLLKGSGLAYDPDIVKVATNGLSGRIKFILLQQRMSR